MSLCLCRAATRTLSSHAENPREIKQLTKLHLSKYAIDPNETARKVIKAFSLHGKVKDPSIISLSTTFEELGLNVLDTSEISLMLEEEFNFEFTEDIFEHARTLGDLADLIAQNWWSVLA